MWAARNNILFYSLLPFKCCCSCCSCMQVSLSLCLSLFNNIVSTRHENYAVEVIPFFSFFLIFGKYTKRNRLLLLVEVIIIFLPTPVMSMAVENSIRLTYKVIRCIHIQLSTCVCVCVCVVSLPSSFLLAAIGNCKKFHLRCAALFIALLIGQHSMIWAASRPSRMFVYFVPFFFFWWRPLWLFLI
jgi:hypothetical protein